jgi:hypothetical protein
MGDRPEDKRLVPVVKRSGERELTGLKGKDNGGSAVRVIRSNNRFGPPDAI